MTRRSRSNQHEKAKEWTMLHFSQADTKGDVAALLNRVADSIRSLGVVHIHDVTFHDELDEHGDACPTMTVYYSREDQ